MAKEIKFVVWFLICLLVVSCGGAEVVEDAAVRVTAAEVIEEDGGAVVSATVVPSATAEPTLMPTTASARATIARTPRAFPTPTFTPSPTVDATAVAQIRTREATEWPPRINHQMGVQVVIPPDWVLSTTRHYGNPRGDGSLRLLGYQNEEAGDLAAVCASDEVAIALNVAGYQREMAVVNGRDVCLISESTAETPRHALIAYPTPWRYPLPDDNGFSGPFQFLLLTSRVVPVTDIVASLEFPETASAEAYLRGVVDNYRLLYVFQEQFDFVSWQDGAVARLSPDSSIEEVYELVEELFTELRLATQHDHLEFYTPERVQSVLLASSRTRLGLMLDGEGYVWLVEPDSPAAEAGLQVGDRLMLLNGDPLEQIQVVAGDNELVFERNGQQQTVSVAPEEFSRFWPAQSRSFTERIAYVETFGYSTVLDAEMSRYLTQMHDTLTAVDGANTCWILDVRRNLGGSVHAILGGIGPFAGNGELYLNRVDGQDYPLYYENGRVYADGLRYFDAAPADPYTLSGNQHTIAILVSERTASMGELSAIVVATQPENQVRIFGEQTQGLSSAVAIVPLIDGAAVKIPRTVWVDLNGDMYLQGVIPDELVDVVFDTRYGTLDDPVVQAAVAWLENEQGCR